VFRRKKQKAPPPALIRPKEDVRPQSDGMLIFDDWNTEMAIRLSPDRTEDEVVDFVLLRGGSGVFGEDLLIELQNEFQITSKDAALARDRTYGGVECASAGNPAHRPERSLDPFGWISFGRALDDPSIISDLRREGIVSPDAMTAIVKNQATGLPEPWSVPDERTRKGLTWELRKEVRSLRGCLSALVFKGHPLFGVRAEVVNRCDACDEVLVRVGEGDFGMVHLTWAGWWEHPPWPNYTHTGGYVATELAQSVHGRGHGYP
jgi:hypothetical protein